MITSPDINRVSLRGKLRGAAPGADKLRDKRLQQVIVDQGPLAPAWTRSRPARIKEISSPNQPASARSCVTMTTVFSSDRKMGAEVQPGARHRTIRSRSAQEARRAG